MSSLLYSTSVAVSVRRPDWFPHWLLTTCGWRRGRDNLSHDLANAHDCEHFLRMSISESIWLDLCASVRNLLK